jgi:hypothetical protein
VLLVTDGGIVNKILSGAVFVIASLNLINGLYQQFEPGNIYLLTILLYLISAMLLWLKIKTILSIILLVMAILTSALNADINNFSGSILFVLSFLAFGKKLYIIPISIATIISLSIKSNKFDIPFNSTISLMIAYIFIYLVFYFVVYKKIEFLKDEIKDLQKQLKEKRKEEPILRNIDVINIKEEEKAIIKLYCNGMDYENISKFLGLNVVPKTIRKRITDIKKEYNIKTDAHFAHWAFSKV